MNIPEHWKRVHLKDIAKWGSGGTPKSTVHEYYNGNIPWLIIGDLNDSYILTSKNRITEIGLKNSSAKIVKPGSILIAMYGSIGKLGINKIPLATNQAIAFTETLHSSTFNKFLFYYLLYIRPLLFKLGKGGTQLNISQTVLKVVDFPLPPLPEQHRIVEKIEELFSELDNGIANLKEAKEQLKVYRQSVLKWAFEGRLATIETKLKFSEIGKYIEEPRYGTSKKCQYEFGNKGVIRIPNIINGFVDTIDLKYGSFSDEEILTYNLKDGDLLIIRSNGSVSLVGKSALIRRTDEEYLYAGYLIRLRPYSSKISSKYLFHVLSSPYIREQIEFLSKSTSGVNNINAKEIKTIKFPYTDLENQLQIVEEIEIRFSLADKIDHSIDESLLQAEALRQSILKSAFEGRLV